MRCTSPRTVGFKADGKTIAWSPKDYSKEYASFQLPCGQCIECRLDYARQWAVRCVHEAKMHPENSFITLTYEKLETPKLVYGDFQNFTKKLRKSLNHKIGYIVAGEYGEQTKRPHWHAIFFNYSPPNPKKHYTTERGDKVYTSEKLTELWGHGHAEFGSVTFHSAGYVARYSAKKLVHGYDQQNEFRPIFKASTRQAVGKAFLEKYWKDIFSYGKVTLSDGTNAGSIPRYYTKWLKEKHPNEWRRYVTGPKIQREEFAEKKSAAVAAEFLEELHQRSDAYQADGLLRPYPITQLEIRKEITKARFKLLESFRKL